jgi:hypothetical protein
MFNLVFLKERGHNFQHLKQCVTLQYLAIHDKAFFHKQFQKLSLSKFQEMAFGKAIGFSFKYVFYCLVHPIQSLLILSLGTKMVM